MHFYSIHFIAELYNLSGSEIICRQIGNTIFTLLYSSWHNHWKTHTLSGTHLVLKTLYLSGTSLENPTFCGTDIGQNGTLAVLALESLTLPGHLNPSWAFASQTQPSMNFYLL